MVIGVTGGTASGQTTVSRILEKKGAYVINGDELGKEVVKNPVIINALIRIFGKDILDTKGHLNRKKLGEIVFTDPQKQQTFDSIVHPPLLSMLRQRIRKATSKYNYIIVDGALLIELDITSWFDVLIVVYAEEETRINRLMKRDNLGYELAKKRIEAQLPLKKKKELADYVVYNDNNLNDTLKQVNKIWNELIERE